MKTFDAYDISKQILELYSANVNKSSGEISKNSLTIPLYYNTDNTMHKIYEVFYVEDFGIVLR